MKAVKCTHPPQIALGQDAGFGQPVAELYTSVPSFHVGITCIKKSCMLSLHENLKF